jgi:hypothetical protein
VFLLQAGRGKSRGKKKEEMGKEMLQLKVNSGFCEAFKAMYISAFIYFQSRILTCHSRHNF